MTSTVCTLVLVVVAIMASGGSSAPVRAAPADAGPGLGCAGGVACFVCVKCTEASQLSSRCLHDMVIVILKSQPKGPLLDHPSIAC